MAMLTWLAQTIRIGAATAYSLTFPAADAAGAMTSDGAGTLSFASTAGAITQLDDDATQVGTDADTAEKTLYTHTVPAATLGVNLQKLVLKIHGRRGASTQSEILKFKFGGTTLLTYTFSGHTNHNNFSAEVTIVRTGAATQKAQVNLQVASGSSFGYTTPAETLSGTVVLSMTGQNTSATANSLIFEFATLYKHAET